MKLIYVWMLTTLVLAGASPVRAVENDLSQATFRFIADHGTFLIRVFEVQSGKSTNEKIHIECIEKCREPISYEEKVDGNVLGVFELMDAENIIFSTWAVSDGYAVRVYKISFTSITKIFDEYTGLPPDFINVDSPGLIIRTSKPGKRGDNSKDKLKFIEWRWDGAVFKRTKVKTH